MRVSKVAKKEILQRDTVIDYIIAKMEGWEEVRNIEVETKRESDHQSIWAEMCIKI